MQVIRPLDIETFSGEFASRLNTWLVIGDQDTRVYTNSAVKFMRAVQVHVVIAVSLSFSLSCSLSTLDAIVGSVRVARRGPSGAAQLAQWRPPTTDSS